MNIAIISSEFPPITNWGGVATFNENLAFLLSSMGHNVFVIALNNNINEPKTVSTNGYKVRYVTYSSGNLFVKAITRFCRIFVGYYFPKLAEIIIWNIYSLIEFNKINKRNTINVVHAPSYQSPVFLLSLFKPKTNIFLHLHGPQQFLNKYERYSLDNIICAAIENFSMEYLCRKVIVCSEYLRSKILQEKTMIEGRIIVISNFIKKESIHKYTFNKKRIVYWGRLEYRKGVDLLLRSFNKLASLDKKLELYLIGSENGYFKHRGKEIDFKSYFRSVVKKELVRRIHVLPKISDRKKLIGYLAKLRGIAIFPSRYEPFGFVTIEAMNLGYLTVSSRLGGGKEITSEDMNGYTVYPTVSSIINTINKLQKLTKRKLDSILRNANRDITEKYGFKMAKQNYKNLYDSEIYLNNE